jgi:SAM-dependent methyltransferase
MNQGNLYWNSYYDAASGVVSESPSQFAAFVIGEIGAGRTIVDVGCGTGRDALFFARHGCRVVGVDASPVAVDLCLRRRDELGLSDRAAFVCDEVGSASLSETLRAHLNGGPVVVYARFFLHAIGEEAEASFIKIASELVCERSILAVEFRTHRDSMLRKETPGHFRRYIEPARLVARLGASGLQVDYLVEGFGYAKYRADDAHTARLVCTRAAAA